MAERRACVTVCGGGRTKTDCARSQRSRVGQRSQCNVSRRAVPTMAHHADGPDGCGDVKRKRHTSTLQARAHTICGERQRRGKAASRKALNRNRNQSTIHSDFTHNLATSQQRRSVSSETQSHSMSEWKVKILPFLLRSQSQEVAQNH